MPSTAQIPAEVAAEFQKASTAWNSGNLGGFLAFYAENATFALADVFLQGRPAIRNFYAPNFAPGARRDELGFEKLDIEVLAPDAVLVRGIYANTQQGQVSRRGTTSLILRRIAGQWQIVHDHTN
ncbi:MAG: SgcJ/EcaC family oxidoreductase [Verrucomicrobiota bacterium]